jgi:hypothetical protein
MGGYGRGETSGTKTFATTVILALTISASLACFPMELALMACKTWPGMSGSGPCPPRLVQEPFIALYVVGHGPALSGLQVVHTVSDMFPAAAITTLVFELFVPVSRPSSKTAVSQFLCKRRSCTFSFGDFTQLSGYHPLLDEWRATFAPNSGATFDDHFEAIKTMEALVLDDLGAESATPWAQDKLYQLFDHRYVHRLPTVITTNVRWMDIPDRIRSRLSDSEVGRVVVNAAPDYRSAEGKKAYQATQRVGAG